MVGVKNMEQYFKLYKFLFEDEFKSLSIGAKIIYSVMIDRMELSIKNNWMDNEGKSYIFMTIEDIQEKINCSKQTAQNVLKELEYKELIIRVRQGFGKPNKIYVQKIDFKKSKNHNSRSLKNRLQEVQILDPNKTNINKTEYNKTDINNKSGAKAPDKEVAFEVPLKDGSYYGISQQDIDIYKNLYPNIDIDQEIKNIIGWNMANASKRKTKVGIKKHINTWLSRANQNKGGTNFGASIERQATGSTATNKPTTEDFRELIQKYTTVL